MSAAPRARHLGDFEIGPDVLLLCALAVPIGGVSAALAWLLLRLIGLCTNLFFHFRLDTTLTTPSSPHWWLVLATPVVGGLLVGLLARYGSERIRGHGMPETIEAVLVGGSVVAPRVALLKPISAALSIGSGGPFGAEGPIIMTGGAAGSVIAQFLRLTTDQRKALLVSGSVAGMAATFNTPLASIMLAVELLLFEWRPRSLLPASVAVVTAVLCRGPLLGTATLFPMAGTLPRPGPAMLGGAAAVGVAGGLLAVVATTLLYRSEDLFARLPVHWMWWPALGGLVIGAGGLVQPRALGVGYDVIGELLTGHAALALVVSILVVKTLIWSISLGSGTSGGVLAPTLMIGAALGALVGQAVPAAVPGVWALVGLAAALGGVMRCPLTGTVFALELTGLWSALIPVVTAAMCAYLVSVLLLKRSVLTEKVARRGFHLSRDYSVDPLEVLFAREVMDTGVVTLDRDRVLAGVLAEFTAPAHVLDRDPHHRQRLYPVLAGERLVGVISRRDLLGLHPDDPRTDGEAMVADPVVARHDQTLREVAHTFARHGVARAPVVDREDPTRLVGLITVTQLLAGRERDLHEERVRRRVLGRRAG